MKREIIIEREQIREVNLDRKKEQFRELCGTEDSIRELFKLLYIDKIATKEELKNLFTVRNISFDMAYDILIEEGYIEEVSFIKEIKNDKRTLIKAGKLMETLALDCSMLDDLIDIATSLDRKGRLLDGYNLGIADHTSVEHFADIKYLIKICTKENILYLDKFEDVKIELEDVIVDFRYGNTKRVEADLIIKYNKQWIICEVERGTTSEADMRKKMNKIQAAVYNAKEKYTGKGFTNLVIVAAPNSKSLEKVKAKIKKWENDYDWRYSRKEVNKPRNLDFLYINLSSITSAKGKSLSSRIKDKKSKNKKAVI